MVNRKVAVVIDDCEAVRMLIKKLLENLGYEVQDFPAPSDHVCTHFYTENSCDSRIPCCELIITDYKIPGFTNGIDFLKQQSERQCKIPKMAVVSGSWDDEAEEEIERLGIKAFNKPFEMDDFKNWALN